MVVVARQSYSVPNTKNRRGELGMELPKTEAELQGIIDNAVSVALEGAKKEYDGKLNSGMASVRKDYDSKLAKVKSDYEASVDVEAEKKATEKVNAFMEEYNSLKAFKKSSDLSQRLAKEGLPDFFKNDARLLNATDDTFDKMLKQVKSEYEATQPKGNTHSSVVKTNVGGNTTGGDEAKAAFGEALKELIGR